MIYDDIPIWIWVGCASRRAAAPEPQRHALDCGPVGSRRISPPASGSGKPKPPMDLAAFVLQKLRAEQKKAFLANSRQAAEAALEILKQAWRRRSKNNSAPPWDIRFFRADIPLLSLKRKKQRFCDRGS